MVFALRRTVVCGFWYSCTVGLVYILLAHFCASPKDMYSSVTPVIINVGVILCIYRVFAIAADPTTLRAAFALKFTQTHYSSTLQN